MKKKLLGIALVASFGIQPMYAQKTKNILRKKYHQKVLQAGKYGLLAAGAVISGSLSYANLTTNINQTVSDILDPTNRNIYCKNLGVNMAWSTWYVGATILTSAVCLGCTYFLSKPIIEKYQEKPKSFDK